MPNKTIYDLPEAPGLPENGECLLPVCQEYRSCEDGKTLIPVPLYKISFLKLVKATREKIDENYDVKMIYDQQSNSITFRLKKNNIQVNVCPECEKYTLGFFGDNEAIFCCRCGHNFYVKGNVLGRKNGNT